MRNIWYRGCMLIIKKFKMLRTRQQQQELQSVKQNKMSQWTLAGYNSGLQQNLIDPAMKDKIDPHDWFESNDKMTSLQKYFMRTATVHQDVHIKHYILDPGFESNAIPFDIMDYVLLDDLVDIRENSAYIAFVSMIGGYINFEENGYSILAKEYKKELKYAAGNIMQLQLREFIDKTMTTLKNFFKGFLTIDKIKKACNNTPIRKVRPTVTSSMYINKPHENKNQKKKTRAQQMEDSKYQNNPQLTKQLGKMQQKSPQGGSSSQNVANHNASVASDQPQHIFKEPPFLNLPEFMDYQDLFNPVFRLELNFGSSLIQEHQVDGVSVSNNNMGQNNDKMSIGGITSGSFIPKSQGSFQRFDCLEFNRKEQDILSDFEQWITRLITSFNDFQRPEFSKVDQISQKKHTFDMNERIRQNKLNKQIKQSQLVQQSISQQNKNQSASNGSINKMSDAIKNSVKNLFDKNAGIVNSSSQASLHTAAGQAKLQDFDTILYQENEMGADIYKNFMGRVSVIEDTTKDTKLLNQPNQSQNIFSRSKVDRLYNIASQHDQYYKGIKDQILGIIQRHLRETRRVLEIYSQFDPIIKHHMEDKVAHFLQSPRKESEYKQIINELKWYQILSTQLPTIVFMPMFEIGVKTVKVEIQSRITKLLNTIYRHFERKIKEKSISICQQYTDICSKLDQQNNTPEDVVDMERYKNNLLSVMGQLREQMEVNRQGIFFMLHNDNIFEQESLDLIKELHEWPRRLNEYLEEADERHRQERKVIEDQLYEDKLNFNKSCEELYNAIQGIADWSDLQSYRKHIKDIENKAATMEEYEKIMRRILEAEQMMFNMQSDFSLFTQLKNFFNPYCDMWKNVHNIMVKKTQWLEQPMSRINPDEVDVMVKQSTKTLQKLKRLLSHNSAAHKVLESMGQELIQLNNWLPTIEVLCNPALKARHWTSIQKIANTPPNHKEISLSSIIKLNIRDFLPQLAEISEKARKEQRLEKMLDKMENEWKELHFTLVNFRDSGIKILQGQNIEELQTLLDEHVMTSQTIRSAPEVAPIESRATKWDQTITYIQEVLEKWINVQTNYLYLEPIFGSDDIKQKLKAEAQSFKRVDRMWRELMGHVQQNTQVLNILNIKGIKKNLDDAETSLENIQKRLNDYLETKRQYFPRFYFLANEDLLEILGDSKNPQKVQKHLKKIFEGINEVIFGDENYEQIDSIVSRQYERVNLVKLVYPGASRGNSEQWLSQLEVSMKESIQSLINESLLEYTKGEQDSKDSQQRLTKAREWSRTNWIRDWQNQIVLTVSQILWTQKVEECLKSNDPQGNLCMYHDECTHELNEIVDLVRRPLDPLLRMSLGSLIVLDVHSKDVVEDMINKQVMKTKDFDWISQLRYYFEANQKHTLVKMITTVQHYGYEYLGNTTRLVITPLTDKCYRTLMSALHLNLGGAPEGPAGTGKTETVKDLAKAVANHCMVFNCAEGLNAKAMARFFMGLASNGSWSCFDEFNRIELEVLSVVAQQILEIQTAKNNGITEDFEFEGVSLTLKSSCNVFITMNPGYAGRADLPDNLKALFRPVAMMIPDYTMIAEISLYSFGFQDSRQLAKKIVAIYRLCSEQLSYQYHYDYGMRAVKAVLTSAKNLKQEQQDENEGMLILRSINEVNLPKFLAHDLPLFKGITEDLFQDVVMYPTAYGQLSTHITESIKACNLQDIEPFVDKVYQLYDMIQVRHGLMLVGPPMGGKSSTIQVLKRALIEYSKQETSSQLPVDTYVINPKSILLSQLYGSYDQISQDFQDGILGIIFRQAAYKNPGKSLRWIVFDGPVDAEWIENMNTVLDDNKKLCLMNGEVIMMNDQMNMIFETQDLQQASPATVSRCGMVYLEPQTLGWRPMLKSWIAKLQQDMLTKFERAIDNDYIVRINNLYECMFDECSEFVIKKCQNYIPVFQIQLAMSHMNIMRSLMLSDSFFDLIMRDKILPQEINIIIDVNFSYSTIWSVGVATDDNGQRNFSNFFKKKQKEVFQLSNGKPFKMLKEAQIPDTGINAHNFFFKNDKWNLYKDKLNEIDKQQVDNSFLSFHEIIIPTIDSLKNNQIFEICMQNRIPTLFIGPTGTGKTVMIQNHIKSISHELYQTISVGFSAQTQAAQVQEQIMSKLEKRGRKILGPVLGKKCIIFIDDLNMPQLEKYGAQPPIELMRQYMDHNGWYDFMEKDKGFVQLIDLIFISAMGPPGGGKNPVTPRYLRHFNQIQMQNQDDVTLQRIFGKLMDWFIQVNEITSFEAKRALTNVVPGAIDVFLNIQKDMLPTPAKSHYLFNLRDVSRVIQGIQSVHKQKLTSIRKVIRLWIHEMERVFGDRFIDKADSEKFYRQVIKSGKEKVREDILGALEEVSEYGSKVKVMPEVMINKIMFTTLLDDQSMVGSKLIDEVTFKQQETLVTRANWFLEEYNNLTKKQMDLVLFDFAIMHCIRILRVIAMARGNCFLVGLGGTGRQSLSKLATFMADFNTFDIEMSKQYSKENWKDDMKRLLLATGQDNKNISFIIIDDLMRKNYILEDINQILNTGEIPNLFSLEENVQIVERMRPLSRREGRHDLYHGGTKQQFLDYFVEKVRQKLHIIISMSPLGSTMRDRIRSFPSFVNCSTINWIQTWPQEALRAVCDRFLSELDINEQQKQATCQVCQQFHYDILDLSVKYNKEQKRYNYVTPTSFLELVLTYKQLYEKHKKRLAKRANNYKFGIDKLKSTRNEIQKMQLDLNEKQPKLEQMTVEADELIVKINKEREEVVEPKKRHIEEEESAAHLISSEAQSIKIECDNELSKAMPILQKAMDALNTIKPNHINEIKVLNNTPATVKKVMHAVCVMCQIKPERTPKKDNVKELEDNWWLTAQHFMNEKNFLGGLIAYNKDNIPEKVMREIRRNFIDDPDFKPSRVEKASFAAKGLCQWIRALDQYDKVVKMVQPKRDKAQQAEMKYQEALKGLHEKQKELKLIVDEFEQLTLKLDDTNKHKDNLENDIEDCKNKLDRAETLLSSLSGEQDRWQNEIEVLNEQLNTFPGDIVLSSAMIVYLGAFPKSYRDNQVEEWIEDIQRKKQLSVSPSFSLIDVLGEPVTIRQWNLSGLPADSFSTENAIIMSKTRRWPLMIDPQGQGNKWIKNLESLKNLALMNKGHKSKQLQVLKLSDPDYIKTLEQSITLGMTVILENIGEEIDPILEPVLLKQTYKNSGSLQIAIGESIIEYSEDFRLIISSKYSNPHFLPELSTKVTLINFMITYDGLTDQLLNILVSKENADIEAERQLLVVQSYENKKQLFEIEVKILEELRKAKANILDDEKAIDVLNQSQILSEEIKQKQIVAEKTNAKLEEARTAYMPFASVSSLMFFILSKLQFVDVMYKYSLNWFIQLFQYAIANTEQTDDIQERVEGLKEYFVKSVFNNVSRSLFEKDKLMFTFILVAKLKEFEQARNFKQSENQSNPSHLFDLLIATIDGVENPTSNQKPEAAKWLDDTAWNKLCTMSQQDEGIFQIMVQFKKHQELIQEFVESEQPMEQELDKELYDQLTNLKININEMQKLCLIKALKPDKLVHCIQYYIQNEMGSEFLSPPIFNIDHSFQDSSYSTPLIFVLPGADPMESLINYAKLKKKHDTLVTISLGQDQGPKAEQAIEQAKLRGTWVMLQNCHLYPSWMPKLEKICDQLEMKVNGKDPCHPSFRLWLTSYTNDSFPDLVLQNGIKMTNEPPKGFKSNLRGTYKLDTITDPVFFNNNNNSRVFKKLLFGLAVFHAVIQERKRYGSLGWNLTYQFTISDLQISAKQLYQFVDNSKEKDIPFNALIYLTGQCNYGGKVTDDKDQRILMAILQDFYNESVLQDKPNNLYNLEGFEIPNDDMHHYQYMEYIESLPLKEPPQLFGFHENAHITKCVNETLKLCDDLTKMGEVDGIQQQYILAHKQELEESDLQNVSRNDTSNSINVSPSKTGKQGASSYSSKKYRSRPGDRTQLQAKSKEEQMEQFCRDILTKLPRNFDIEEAQKNYPITRENSMNTVLIQELQRYNFLMSQIKDDLQKILLALKGEVIASEKLEKVQYAIQIQKIPESWLANSYPSIKSLAGYIKDLLNRLKMFQQWIEFSNPKIYWFSGFFFPQAFLTAILQNYARKFKIEIDTLEFDFVFKGQDQNDYNNDEYDHMNLPSQQKSDDGAYITGLYLEGARWDYEYKLLVEQRPKVLHCRMPVIELIPKKLEQSKTNLFNDADDEQYYKSPVYMTQSRWGQLKTTGHSSNFLMYMKLPLSGDPVQTSDHWVKRGVAIITQLK